MQRRKQPLTQPLNAKPAPERKCIATGVTASPERFIRFVLAPDGSVLPDFSGKLPGRGAWLTPTRAALDAAVERGAFARAFKSAARASDDLVAIVEAGLAKSALSALGMARRVGDVVVGFEKTRTVLKTKKAAALIAASDGAADGRAKLKSLAGDTPVVEIFDGAELSAALGREHLVHAAIINGAAANRFLRAARRLEGFRAPKDGQ